MTASIVAEGLGKRYWKFHDRPTLIGAILPFSQPAPVELWALRDVNLSVERGESVGIIGRNGSGKTTLLRTLCGITRPTEGRIRVVGRISPLISLGVGFDDELTGRENVALNGMLLGLDKREIAARLEKIVDFAELWEFIDTPVKFYSSGMLVRLGFAVAIHTDPDILLLDEVLAVGDLAYQLKCVERIRTLQERGTTIVMVSHSVSAIKATCLRVVLLSHGRVEADGSVEEGIALYHERLAEDNSESLERVLSAGEKIYMGGATILDRRLLGPEGVQHYAVRNQRLRFQMRVRFDQPAQSPMFCMILTHESGNVIYTKYSPIGANYGDFDPGSEIDMTCDFDPRLVGGTYRANGYVLSNDGRRILASDDRGAAFYLEFVVGTGGAADLGGEISIGGVRLDSSITREIDIDKAVSEPAPTPTR